jgi:hypothetical protein
MKSNPLLVWWSPSWTQKTEKKIEINRFRVLELKVSDTSWAIYQKKKSLNKGQLQEIPIIGGHRVSTPDRQASWPKCSERSGPEADKSHAAADPLYFEQNAREISAEKRLMKDCLDKNYPTASLRAPLIAEANEDRWAFAEFSLRFYQNQILNVDRSQTGGSS